ncbi:MAG: hypothetical protein MK008_05370 [Bdellovibrionales bacterium]|nr:hypothetical protein [Bdellovibrionales bacterium]
MKKLLVGLTLLVSMSSFASDIKKNDLLGISVAKIDIDGPFFVVQLIVNDDGTFNYRDANMDHPMPKPGCSGEYTFSKNVFLGTLDCSAIGGPNAIQMSVDFTNVTKEKLNSEKGAAVSVNIPGDGEMPFRIFKRSELYFND